MRTRVPAGGAAVACDIFCSWPSKYFQQTSTTTVLTKRRQVFKMLWTEPAGQVNPGKTRNSTHFSTVQYGETAFSEIRRFVVVRNKGEFSQCMYVDHKKRLTLHVPNSLVQSKLIEVVVPQSRA
jgi:hypothetical protein